MSWEGRFDLCSGSEGDGSASEGWAREVAGLGVNTVAYLSVWHHKPNQGGCGKGICQTRGSLALACGLAYAERGTKVERT